MQPLAPDYEFPLTTNLSDLELFSALKDSKPAALEQLYDRYGDLMYGLAFRILGNRQEAEDVIQEIFLTLWRNCAYDPERGSFKSFLMIIVRSRSIDRLRSQKTTSDRAERWGRGFMSGLHSKIPLDQAVSDEISQRVESALAELPEKQRQALQMAYFGGLTQQEIAQALNVPIGTVKSWFRLGFTKLRQSLQDLIS